MFSLSSSILSPRARDIGLPWLPPSSAPGAGGSGPVQVCGAALPPTCLWLRQGLGHPIMSISVSITALGMAQLGEMVPLTLHLCAPVWLGRLLPVCSQVLCGLWCSPGTSESSTPTSVQSWGAPWAVVWENGVCIYWVKSHGEAACALFARGGLLSCQRHFIYT